MREELPASDIGKEIVQHADDQRHAVPHARLDRRLSIAEAILLSLVAVLAGWSGYAAAKWSTDSSLNLAQESAARTKGNRVQAQSMQTRNFDASTFNAWFAAYTAGNREAMDLAVRRFRPEFRAAFDAWRATNPETNPDAPPGPTYMTNYHPPGAATVKALDAAADHHFERGESAGRTADDYVRTTVFLAIVLFVVGISAHFPVRGGRYVLIGVGSTLLVFSLVLILGLPGPPSH